MSHIVPLFSKTIIMKRILVLGAGLVGSAIIRDLSKDHEVLAADIDQEKLDKLKGVQNVTLFQGDLLSPKVFNEIAGKADLIVGALPGSLGYRSVRNSILAGKNMVDISFFPEDETWSMAFSITFWNPSD